MHNEQTMGVGVVIRNRNRKFINARNAHIFGVTNHLIFEVMAAGEGLMFAWELGFEDVLEVGSLIS